MGNIIKGILYAGLAATVGAIGYIAGKSKHWKGISLTTMGLALILYTPRGCDMLERYAIIRGEVAKAKIYGYAKMDSLDAVIRREDARDSSKSYFLNALKEVSLLEENLTNSYSKMVSRTKEEYATMLSETDAGYSRVLDDMKKQNDALVKRLDVMTELQEQANSTVAKVIYGNAKGDEGANSKEASINDVNHAIEEKSEDPPDGRTMVVTGDIATDAAARRKLPSVIYPPNATPEEIEAVRLERARQDMREKKQREAINEYFRSLENSGQNTRQDRRWYAPRY